MDAAVGTRLVIKVGEPHQLARPPSTSASRTSAWRSAVARSQSAGANDPDEGMALIEDIEEGSAEADHVAALVSWALLVTRLAPMRGGAGE